MDESKAIIGGTVLTVKRYCRLLNVLLPLGHANEIKHFLSARKIHLQAKDMTMSESFTTFSAVIWQRTDGNSTNN